ncbi:MAG: hypothetical protein ACXAEU_19910, partial [Candidatus Hodarchaeales archaeon]
MAENGKGPLKSKTFYPNEKIGLSIARWPYRIVDGQSRPGKISFQIVHFEDVDGKKKRTFGKTIFYTPNDARRVADWISQWAYEQDVENDEQYRESKRGKTSYTEKTQKTQVQESNLSEKELEEILFALYTGETTIISRMKTSLEEKNIDIPI